MTLPVLRSLSTDAQAWGIEIDPNTILPDNPLRSRIYEKPLGDDIYNDKRFNLITALDVIEHIEDDTAAIDNMLHMLEPGGWLVLTVPALPALWTQHDQMNMHYRRYTRANLTELLKPHGELLDCRYLYTALALPKLALAALQRIYPSKPSTPQVPFGLLNRVAKGYFKAEWALTKRCPMPFGSSLIAVLRKPEAVATSAPKPANAALSTAA